MKYNHEGKQHAVQENVQGDPVTTHVVGGSYLFRHTARSTLASSKMSAVLGQINVLFSCLQQILTPSLPMNSIVCHQLCFTHPDFTAMSNSSRNANSGHPSPHSSRPDPGFNPSRADPQHQPTPNNPFGDNRTYFPWNNRGRSSLCGL